MTATDELREGLRKRGESWHKWPDDYSTTWQAYSNPHTATESMDGTLIVTGLTPAQAIEATLGRGTCHDKNGFDPELGFECTVCGAMVDTYMVTPMEMGHVRQFAYCPFCGRHVVEVGE